MEEPPDQPALEPPTPHGVLNFYNSLPEIYAVNDRWLQVTHEWIQAFVSRRWKSAGLQCKLSCLNVGSGGLSYGLPEAAMLHVDLHAMRFSAHQNVVIADIQRLPLRGGVFSHCLCVGSVLNHCDAAAVIGEAASVLRPDGELIMEFETSRSFELLGTTHFGKQAAVINTFYHERTITLWAYSERYVRGLLDAFGFRVLERDSCHHLSPLVYLVTRNGNLAARFHVFDPILRRIPKLKGYASHVIYVCRRA